MPCGSDLRHASTRQWTMVAAICRAARRTSRESKPPSMSGTASVDPDGDDHEHHHHLDEREAAAATDRVHPVSPPQLVTSRFVSCAAGRAVGAERVEVVRAPAVAGAAVEVRPVPRVLRHVLVEIRSVPPLQRRRALDQRREPFLRASGSGRRRAGRCRAPSRGARSASPRPASSAFSDRPMRCGPTSAISSPMMTMTTMISMSVNPACRRRRSCHDSVPSSDRQIVDAEDRRQHRHHDEADDQPHDQDQHRLEQPRELLDPRAHLAVVVVRRP